MQLASWLQCTPCVIPRNLWTTLSEVLPAWQVRMAAGSWHKLQSASRGLWVNGSLIWSPTAHFYFCTGGMTSQCFSWVLAGFSRARATFMEHVKQVDQFGGITPNEEPTQKKPPGVFAWRQKNFYHIPRLRELAGRETAAGPRRGERLSEFPQCSETAWQQHWRFL